MMIINIIILICIMRDIGVCVDPSNNEASSSSAAVHVSLSQEASYLLAAECRLLMMYFTDLHNRRDFVVKVNYKELIDSIKKNYTEETADEAFRNTRSIVQCFPESYRDDIKKILLKLMEMYQLHIKNDGQLIEDTDSFCSVFSVDCIQMFRDLPVNFPADIDRLLLPSKRPFL